MTGDTYLQTVEHTGPTLSFAGPLEPIGHERTYQYRETTIILEDVTGPGRADYSVWERNPEDGVWELTDDDPGIVELLHDDTYSEPCADCLQHVAPGEFDHDEDCPIGNDDEDAWDTVEGFFCCLNMSATYEEAHAAWKLEHPEATCSFYPDFALLDGGDVLCRAHVAEWFGGMFLWVGHDDGSERDAMLRQYFNTRRNLGDEHRNIPDPEVLRKLSELSQMRRRLEQADRLRTKRDETIAALRDAVSQATIGDYAGVTQQRIGAIHRDAAETLREMRARWEREANN